MVLALVLTCLLLAWLTRRRRQREAFALQLQPPPPAPAETIALADRLARDEVVEWLFREIERVEPAAVRSNDFSRLTDDSADRLRALFGAEAWDEVVQRALALAQTSRGGASQARVEADAALRVAGMLGSAVPRYADVRGACSAALTTLADVDAAEEAFDTMTVAGYEKLLERAVAQQAGVAGVAAAAGEVVRAYEGAAAPLDEPRFARLRACPSEAAMDARDINTKAIERLRDLVSRRRLRDEAEERARAAEAALKVERMKLLSLLAVAAAARSLEFTGSCAGSYNAGQCRRAGHSAAVIAAADIDASTGLSALDAPPLVGEPYLTLAAAADVLAADAAEAISEAEATRYNVVVLWREAGERLQAARAGAARARALGELVEAAKATLEPALAGAEAAAGAAWAAWLAQRAAAVVNAQGMVAATLQALEAYCAAAGAVWTLRDNKARVMGLPGLPEHVSMFDTSARERLGLMFDRLDERGVRLMDKLCAAVGAAGSTVSENFFVDAPAEAQRMLDIARGKFGALQGKPNVDVRMATSVAEGSGVEAAAADGQRGRDIAARCARAHAEQPPCAVFQQPSPGYGQAHAVRDALHVQLAAAASTHAGAVQVLLDLAAHVNGIADEVMAEANGISSAVGRVSVVLPQVPDAGRTYAVLDGITQTYVSRRNTVLDRRARAVVLRQYAAELNRMQRKVSGSESGNTQNAGGAAAQARLDAITRLQDLHSAGRASTDTALAKAPQPAPQLAEYERLQDVFAVGTFVFVLGGQLLIASTTAADVQPDDAVAGRGRARMQSVTAWLDLRRGVYLVLVRFYDAFMGALAEYVAAKHDSAIPNAAALGASHASDYTGVLPQLRGGTACGELQMANTVWQFMVDLEKAAGVQVETATATARVTEMAAALKVCAKSPQALLSEAVTAAGAKAGADAPAAQGTGGKATVARRLNFTLANAAAIAAACGFNMGPLRSLSGSAAYDHVSAVMRERVGAIRAIVTQTGDPGNMPNSAVDANNAHSSYAQALELLGHINTCNHATYFDINDIRASAEAARDYAKAVRDERVAWINAKLSDAYDNNIMIGSSGDDWRDFVARELGANKAQGTKDSVSGLDGNVRTLLGGKAVFVLNNDVYKEVGDRTNGSVGNILYHANNNRYAIGDLRWYLARIHDTRLVLAAEVKGRAERARVFYNKRYMKPVGEIGFFSSQGRDLVPHVTHMVCSDDHAKGVRDNCTVGASYFFISGRYRRYEGANVQSNGSWVAVGGRDITFNVGNLAHYANMESVSNLELLPDEVRTTTKFE